MVYCGKPSKACHACRAKKTRCDALPNGCTQCAKAKRICPGYRSQIDLVFRDQSEHTVQKAKTRESKKAKSSSNFPIITTTAKGIQSQEFSEDVEVVEQESFGPLVSLSSSLEEQATCFFVSNYILGIQSPGDGLYGSLTKCYRKAQVEDTLLTSIKAVGFAAFAHHTQDTSLTTTSRYHYTLAIRNTNAALTSSEEAVKDSTLVSIMILGLYEMMTGANDRSLEAWAEHIHGAAALLEMRGEAQFQSEAGIDLYFQTAIGLLTSCLQRSISLPKYMIAVTEKFAKSRQFGEHPAFQVHLAMVEINQFRAATRDGTGLDPEWVIEKSLEHDGVLQSMCNNPPEGWESVRTYLSKYDPGIVFRGRCDIYTNPHAIYLWNSIRLVRILLHEKIRDEIQRGNSTTPPMFAFADYADQFQRSTNICLEMQADLLASMPQQLGYISKPLMLDVAALQEQAQRRSSSPRSHSDDKNFRVSTAMAALSAVEASRPNTVSSVEQAFSNLPESIAGMPDVNNIPSIRPANGYLPLWPLWYAGHMDLAEQDSRQYCAQNLRKIGRDGGIYQAFLLAQVIEQGSKMEVWSESRGKFEPA